MIYFLDPSQLEQGMRIIGQGIRQQAEKGKQLQVKVTQAKRMKTTAQNSYYHALLALICNETGENFKRFRLTMKINLHYYTEFWVNGVAEKDIKSMADVTIEESNEFISAALDVCGFLNIRIPSREQHYQDINYDK